MFGRIRQAVVGVVAKTRQVVGRVVSRVGEWISGKPAVRPVVLKPVLNRALQPVRRAYALAALFVFGLMVNFGSLFAADGDPDAAITNAITTFTSTFGAIKTAILAVLVFAIGYKVAKKWLKG